MPITQSDSKCSNFRCPQAVNCLRFTSPSKFGSSWFDFNPLQKDGTCYYFINDPLSSSINGKTV